MHIMKQEDGMHHFMVVQLLASQNTHQTFFYWISTLNQASHTQCKSHHQSQIRNFYSRHWTLFMNERHNHHLNESCTIHDLFLSILYFFNWSCCWSFYSPNKLPIQSNLSLCWFWLPMIVWFWACLRKKHLTNKIVINLFLLF